MVFVATLQLRRRYTLNDSQACSIQEKGWLSF